MKRRVVLCSFAFAALLLGACNEGDDEGGSFEVSLSGEAEVCEDGTCGGEGTGEASIDINTDENEVCYEISLDGIEDVEAAHIHEAEEGKAGDVVVDLAYAGDDEGADDCVDGIDEGTLEDISEEPSQFYVNVHSAEYPDGAARAQLSS